MMLLLGGSNLEKKEDKGKGIRLEADGDKLFRHSGWSLSLIILIWGCGW